MVRYENARLDFERRIEGGQIVRAAYFVDVEGFSNDVVWNEVQRLNEFGGQGWEVIDVLTDRVLVNDSGEQKSTWAARQYLLKRAINGDS